MSRKYRNLLGLLAVLGALLIPLSAVAKSGDDTLPRVDLFFIQSGGGYPGGTYKFEYAVTVYNATKMQVTMGLPRQMKLVSPSIKPRITGARVSWSRSFSSSMAIWDIKFQIKISPSARPGSKLFWTWTTHVEPSPPGTEDQVKKYKYLVLRPPR